MVDFPECDDEQHCGAEEQVSPPDPEELCAEGKYFATLFAQEHPTYHELCHMYLTLRRKINLIEETLSEIRYRWARIVMMSETTSEESKSASQRMIGVKVALDAVRTIKGDDYE